MRFKDENAATEGQRVKGQSLSACAPPTGSGSCWLEARGLLGLDTQSFQIISKTTPSNWRSSSEPLLSYLDIPLLPHKNKTGLTFPHTIDFSYKASPAPRQ